MCGLRPNSINKLELELQSSNHYVSTYYYKHVNTQIHYKYHIKYEIETLASKEMNKLSKMKRQTAISVRYVTISQLKATIMLTWPSKKMSMTPQLTLQGCQNSEQIVIKHNRDLYTIIFYFNCIVESPLQTVCCDCKGYATREVHSIRNKSVSIHMYDHLNNKHRMKTRKSCDDVILKLFLKVFPTKQKKECCSWTKDDPHTDKAGALHNCNGRVGRISDKRQT